MGMKREDFFMSMTIVTVMLAGALCSWWWLGLTVILFLVSVRWGPPKK